MTMISAQFKDLLDKHLNQVHEKVFQDLSNTEAMIPTFYDVMSIDSAWWEEMDIGDLADIPRFNGDLEYLDLQPGYTTRIEPAEFAAAVRFERKLVDDNQWPVLRNVAAQMTESGFRTQEKEGAQLFASAFSSAFTFMYSEEGLSLCNSSHTSKSGASTTNGFDNSGTSALNEVSLEATRILANKFRSDIGERIFTNFDTLVVPDNLAATAFEITKTRNGLYTGDGTINVHAGQPFTWKVIVYKLLDDYDTNNWFLVDSRAMKKFVKWINRIKWEVSTEVKEFESFAVKRSIYGRWGWGFKNWRWVYGHVVG